MNPDLFTNSVPIGPEIEDVPFLSQPSEAENRGKREAEVATDDRLDWDASIPVAPKRPAGWIDVTLEFGGCGKPSPIDEPWA